MLRYPLVSWQSHAEMRNRKSRGEKGKKKKGAVLGEEKKEEKRGEKVSARPMTFLTVYLTASS